MTQINTDKKRKSVFICVNQCSISYQLILQPLKEVNLDKIIIRDLLLRGILGIHPHERIEKQDILINIVVETDIRQAAASDNIEDALNYQLLTERIIDHVENAAPLLAEKLVTEIARIVITEFHASKVVVRVEKPAAQRFARSVGIEIERTRADFE